MRVAVVGGGIFGCAIAIELAQSGVMVDLFEVRSDILGGATARCQARLHRGYHYPRSDETAAAAREGFDEFLARWPEVVEHAPGKHFYAIAHGSKTSPGDYLSFCERMWLGYTVTTHPMVYNARLLIQVGEAMINADILRRLLWRDLGRAGVTVHLDVRLDGWPGQGFDRVVWATYGQPWPIPLRYEICELAIVELGRYANESIVVLDGEYVSLDPWRRGLYALYDVKHSVHHANVGSAPEIPDEYAELIARPGLLRSDLTKHELMLESAGRFLRGLDPGGRGVSIYHGSMYSVRAVLPDVDATDTRPTLIDVRGDQISVLSGKICTALAAAKSVRSAIFGLVPA